MNQSYFAYDQSGAIQYCLTCINLDKGAFEASTGLGTVPVDPALDQSQHYVSGGQALERQALSIPGSMQVIADGQDEAVIANIPIGVSVFYEGEHYEITDGVFEFSTDMPGTYRLLFTAVEYLDQEVVIEALPAT